jgi:hypothetical protein
MKSLKALLKKNLSKTIQKYPLLGKILIPLLRHYRNVRYQVLQWPKKRTGKKQQYFTATHRLYQRFQPYQNRSPQD